MPKFDFTVVVQSPLQGRSGPWSFRINKNDIYVFGNKGDVQKISFHPPDICRLAYTKEYAASAGMPNRATLEWKRDLTTNNPGSFVRLLKLQVGSNTLSAAFKAPSDCRVVEAAPPGSSTTIELAVTKCSEQEVLQYCSKQAAELKHEMIAYRELPNGDRAFITKHHVVGSDDHLALPKTSGESGFPDLLVSPYDPQGTGRPIRVTTYSTPKDGDFLHVWEFGAYRTNALPAGGPTLSRNVVQSSWRDPRKRIA